MRQLLTGSKVNRVLNVLRDLGAAREMNWEGEVTMIGQDDDVQTTVEANLLQPVHQLTHDPVNVLEGQNQLKKTTTNHGGDQRGCLCAAPWWRTADRTHGSDCLQTRVRALLSGLTPTLTGP